jgi:AcrR family transcriptional regulator
MTTKRRTPAPNARQRDPERTKARILDAATEEFSAKGFAGARVAEIAKRAGVNQQLIAYYFDGKEGLYREIGRRWRTYEAQEFTDELAFAETVRRYVEATADTRHGARLLAWEGLADTGEHDEERENRLAQEVEQLRDRQSAGEIDKEFDPAALILIGMSAGTALTVYPHLARALFGADPASPDVVERYAEQLALVLSRLGRK